LLLYHLVFPAKYRKKIFDDVVDKKIRDICIEISKRYEIHFHSLQSSSFVTRYWYFEA